MCLLLVLFVAVRELFAPVLPINKTLSLCLVLPHHDFAHVDGRRVGAQGVESRSFGLEHHDPCIGLGLGLSLGLGLGLGLGFGLGLGLGLGSEDPVGTFSQ